MEKIIDDFIRHKQLTQSSITSNTKNSYIKDLENFLLFLENNNIKKFENVNENVIQDFYSSDLFNQYERTWKNKSGEIKKKKVGKRSESSKNRIASTISSLFKYLVFKGAVISSPVFHDGGKGVKRKSRSNSVKPTLTIKEIEQILSFVSSKNFKESFKFNKRDACIIKTLYYCGLRISELINIQMSDLKLNNASPFMLIRGKGNKLREQPIPMYKNLIDYINNERPLILGDKNCDYLFINLYKNQPRMLTRQGLDKKIKQICLLAGLNIEKSGEVKYKKISAHMFRHSIGTHLHDSGVDLIHVKNHLGHSSISTTERYIKSLKEKEEILKKYGPITGEKS